jgi:hypothetical protein
MTWLLVFEWIGLSFLWRLVDSQALYDGLENGQLGGLGMDVYENESKLLQRT